MRNPFRFFKTSPEIIRLAVMMYVRYPLSLRQVEDLLHERGVDISHETVRARWMRGWNPFGPRLAAEIRKQRIHNRSFLSWRWHLDEVFVRINGELHYLWRAVDHEGEVLESSVTKRRDRKAALEQFQTL
jgi:putative transposase